MEKIEKSWKDLDFDKVDLSHEQTCWTLSRGGHPLGDWEWALSFTTYGEATYEVTRYRLPLCISLIINEAEARGQQNAKQEIRWMLGIKN